MEGVIVTWRDSDWSCSASERRYGLGAADEGCLRIGDGRDFEMSSRESVHVLVTGHVS